MHPLSSLGVVYLIDLIEHASIMRVVRGVLKGVPSSHPSRTIMKKLSLALSALVAILTLLLSNLALADIACPSGGAPPCSGPPSAGGGGCAIAVAHPGGALAFLMITVGIAILAASRRRRA
jgi:hypothetical protein